LVFKLRKLHAKVPIAVQMHSCVEILARAGLIE